MARGSLSTPLRSLLLLLFSSSCLAFPALGDTFPRRYADAELPSGELLGPVVPGTACWPQEEVAFATQNILSLENFLVNDV